MPCVIWFGGLVGVVQTLSYESWEYNMWNNIDAEYQYASVYYILFILLGPFILINVFIAGISSVFLQLRRKNEVEFPPLKAHKELDLLLLESDLDRDMAADR
jgi:phage-related protein